jgi:hypothetical protein
MGLPPPAGGDFTPVTNFQEAEFPEIEFRMSSCAAE